MNYTNKGATEIRMRRIQRRKIEVKTKQMPKRKCHLSLEQHVSETYRSSCYYNLCTPGRRHISRYRRRCRCRCRCRIRHKARVNRNWRLSKFVKKNGESSFYFWPHHLEIPPLPSPPSKFISPAVQQNQSDTWELLGCYNSRKRANKSTLMAIPSPGVLPRRELSA